MRTQLHQKFNDKQPCGGTFLASCFAKTQWAGHPNLANKHLCPAPLSATELFESLVKRSDHRRRDRCKVRPCQLPLLSPDWIFEQVRSVGVSSSVSLQFCGRLPVGPSVYWRGGGARATTVGLPSVFWFSVRVMTASALGISPSSSSSSTDPCGCDLSHIHLFMLAVCFCSPQTVRGYRQCTRNAQDS